MTFDQQEYNSDYSQYDPVKIYPNQFITVMWKTQPITSYWFTVNLTLLSVGFVFEMDMLFQFDFSNEIEFMIFFYFKPNHNLFGIIDFVQIKSSLYAHFTNYHLCQFYNDCGQSRINLVMILYDLVHVSVWINPPVVRTIWAITIIIIVKQSYFDLIVSPVLEKHNVAYDSLDCTAFELDVKWFVKLFGFDSVYPTMMAIETEHTCLSIWLLDFDLIWF